MKYIRIDGEVIDTSDMAIQVGFKDSRGDAHTTWIPRSLCEDGDGLDTGDTDILVVKWYADREDLPTDE